MIFTRKDTPTIMDGMVVRYVCNNADKFEINASRNGVSTNGFMPLVRRQEDLDIVFEYFRRAFRQYAQLAPNARMLHSRNRPFPEEVFETPAAQPDAEGTVERIFAPTLEQILSIIEAKRVVILQNPDDPSWTEHFAELKEQMRQLWMHPAQPGAEGDVK